MMPTFNPDKAGCGRDLLLLTVCVVIGGLALAGTILLLNAVL